MGVMCMTGYWVATDGLAILCNTIYCVSCMGGAYDEYIK